MAQPFDPVAAGAAIQAANANARQALAMAQQAGQVSQQAVQQLAALVKNGEDLKQALTQLAMQRTGGNPTLQYVENIPGRRVPFDIVVNIAIGANITSVQQGSNTINQDGPFVAVARSAQFLSQMAFQYIDPSSGNPATFNGRSYGRYRPIHSVYDLNDGIPRSEVLQAVAPPGAGAPHIISPSNASSFRSMQGDFTILMENTGFAYPRMNEPVPSTQWVKGFTSPWPLPALDVFERGEVITFRAQPLHPNNPSYGNVQEFTGAGNSWPFLGSQYDAVEGISDPVVPDVETDPVTRLPNGVLTVILHGYKIIQPPGSGPY